MKNESNNKYTSIRELIASYEERFIPENAEGIDAIIQIDLTDNQGTSYVVTIKDQKLRIKEGTHEDPLLKVSASESDWLKLNNGEANPMIMMMKRKLKVKGPIEVVAQFQKMFR